MTIRIRAFAIYRELLGRDVIELELPEGITPREAFRHLFQEREDLSRLQRATLFAVNREYVDGEQPLKPGDELALIPPVAGGVELAGARIDEGRTGPRAALLRGGVSTGIVFPAAAAVAIG